MISVYEGTHPGGALAYPSEMAKEPIQGLKCPHEKEDKDELMR